MTSLERISGLLWLVLLLSACLLLCLEPMTTGSRCLAAQVGGVTLRQAERLALEQNLNLQAQQYDLRAAQASVSKAYGLYDPRLDLSLRQGSAQSQLNVFYSPGQTLESSVDYRQYNASLGQKAPTGAELTLGFTNDWQKQQTEQLAPDINPYYESELKFSLVQPLLKNFGPTVTEQGILFALKDRQVGVQDLREQAFTVLGQVRDAFYEVLRTRDDLAYRETSLELARQVLKENRARVEAGVMPPIEILEAEVGVKQREREVLDAQRQHQDALDNLALLLNRPGAMKVADVALAAPPLATDEEAGFRAALTGRPDVQRQLRSIERLGLEQRIARNQRLPALDLNASYSHKGLGGDFSNDWTDIDSARYPNWQVGVTLSYPLGNRAARNEVLRNEVRLKGLRARLGQLRDEVRTQIRAAIRLLDVSRKKIEVTSSGRELAEEKLRSLLKRKDVGLATTRDVLEGEEDLALARTEEITALAEYNQAITQYLRVTGRLLKHEQVYFTGDFAPEAESALLRMAEE